MTRKDNWRDELQRVIFVKTGIATHLQDSPRFFIGGWNYEDSRNITYIMVKPRGINFIEDPSNVTDQVDMRYNIELGFSDHTRVTLRNKRPNIFETPHALDGTDFDTTDIANAYTCRFEVSDPDPSHSLGFYRLDLVIFWDDFNPLNMFAQPQIRFEYSYPDISDNLPVTYLGQKTFSGMHVDDSMHRF